MSNSTHIIYCAPLETDFSKKQRLEELERELPSAKAYECDVSDLLPPEGELLGPAAEHVHHHNESAQVSSTAASAGEGGMSTGEGIVMAIAIVVIVAGCGGLA